MSEAQAPQAQAQARDQAPAAEMYVVFSMKARDEPVFIGRCDDRVFTLIEYLNTSIPRELTKLKVIAIGEEGGNMDYGNSYSISRDYTELLAEDDDGNRYFVLIEEDYAATLLGNAIDCPSEHGTQLVPTEPAYSRSVTIKVRVERLDEAMKKYEWSEEDIEDFEPLGEPRPLVEELLDKINGYLLGIIKKENEDD